MCRAGSAVWRRAAPCAVRTAPCGVVRRHVPRARRGATRRAGRQGRAVWRAVWHAARSFYFPNRTASSARWASGVQIPNTKPPFEEQRWRERDLHDILYR
eukprot:gene11892-biopygen4150